MKFKKKLTRFVLILATGFCVGAMNQSAISQLQWRHISVGSEILFLPLVLLLVWFGWMIRGEWIVAKSLTRKVKKNGNTRRK